MPCVQNVVEPAQLAGRAQGLRATSGYSAWALQTVPATLPLFALLAAISCPMDSGASVHLPRDRISAMPSLNPQVQCDLPCVSQIKLGI